MADDIVTRYRAQARFCNHGYPNGLGDSFPAPTSCNLCSVAREAADEIQRLRALIAEWADAHPDSFSNVDLTGEEWQARMGRFLAAEDALSDEARRG